MSLVPVPGAKAIRDLLTTVLDRDVEVAVADPYVPDAGEPASFAVYVDPTTRARVVGVTDLAFAAHAGAALVRVPPGGVRPALEAGLLPDLVGDSLHEMMRLCASLFDLDDVPPVTLYAVHLPGATPPPDVHAFARVLGGRTDLSVAVRGYGAGRLSFVGLP
jgi:hypothetical protein